MRRLGVLTVSALILNGAGCASTDTMRASSARGRMGRFFSIDWRPGERRGRPTLTGTVHNHYGATATLHAAPRGSARRQRKRDRPEARLAR